MLSLDFVMNKHTPCNNKPYIEARIGKHQYWQEYLHQRSVDSRPSPTINGLGVPCSPCWAMSVLTPAHGIALSSLFWSKQLLKVKTWMDAGEQRALDVPVMAYFWQNHRRDFMQSKQKVSLRGKGILNAQLQPKLLFVTLDRGVKS